MTRPKEKTLFGETIQKKWFFFKRYTFTCDLVIYDAVSFAIIFSTITSNLQSWHKKRRGQSAGFTLRVTSIAPVQAKAIQMMENLYQCDDSFKFLKKCNVTLEIHDVDTHLKDIYIPGDNKENQSSDSW